MAMEENEIAEIKDSNFRYVRWFLFGFAGFDIIHLVCAVTLLIFAYAKKPIEDMEAAECMVEIVFSILLMCFINAMQHHHKKVDLPQVTYTLGYLTASASLFVPLSFSLPEIIEGDWDGSRPIALTLVGICFIIALLCFLSFFFALIFSGKAKVWRVFVIFGLCMMIALVPVQFASYFYRGHEAILLVFHGIKSFAPLCFAPLGIYLVVGQKSRASFFRNSD